MKSTTSFLFGTTCALLFILVWGQAPTLPPAVIAEDAVVSEEPIAEETRYMRQDQPDPACLDNYEQWPNSTTQNLDAPWSTATFWLKPNSSSGSGSFKDRTTDINGDGLPDQQYVYHTDYYNSASKNRCGNTTIGYSVYNQKYSCVHLNNGRGWDIAYRCVTQVECGDESDPNDDAIRYYGDCADVS